MLLIPPTGMRAGPIRSGTYNPSRPNHTARRIAAALVSIISTPCAVRSESASCVQERRLDQRPSISGSQVRALVRPPPSLPKPSTDSSLAERPFLRPFLACGGLRFPVSLPRHRLQAPFGVPVSGGKNPVPNSIGQAGRKSAQGEFGASRQLRRTGRVSLPLVRA